MLASKLFIPTLKDAPADAQIPSTIFMIRGALMRKLASGLYSYLPLGVRVIKKIENIVRQEMNNINSQECLMPLLLSKELLVPSGRWDIFKKELFRLEDRHEVAHALGPTHEEAFTEIVKGDSQSYKQFPISLYQINTKFRDEIRPRFGVIRSREFIMKDAYSFHITDECLDKTYNDMSAAYSKIFSRVGLDTVSVKADSGAMGGSGSEEFMVLSNVGEESIVFCSSCDYRANAERADVMLDDISNIKYTSEATEKLHTPNIKTIEDLEKFFNTNSANFIKTILYKVEDDSIIAVLIRGDIDINETKLSNYLGGLDIELASEEDVQKATNAKVGFAGPIGLAQHVRIIADHSIKTIESAIIGANETDHHIKNINIERDVQNIQYTDIRTAKSGDKCSSCGSELNIKFGLELGHIFKLGQKYTKAFNLSVLEQNNNTIFPTMGCYGIGVNRTFAAVIEQHHDDKGIIFPISIAPFELDIVCVEKEGSESFKVAKDLYEKLEVCGVETLLDDRDMRLGIKLNDADLVGIPMRIVIGKKSIESGQIEFKLRSESENVSIAIDKIVEHVVTTKASLFSKL